MEEGKTMRPSIWSEDELTEEKLRGPGYEEIGTGVFVPEEDAFSFAIERLIQSENKEQKEFVEWYFSGNFIKED